MQLTTGCSSSDALQDLYKSLQVDSEHTISGVDDGGCVIDLARTLVKAAGIIYRLSGR